MSESIAQQVRHYFKVVLGTLSTEEIIKNRELIKRAELIDSMLLKKK